MSPNTAIFFFELNNSKISKAALMLTGLDL